MIKVAFVTSYPVETLHPFVKLVNEDLKLHPTSWIRSLAAGLVDRKEVDLHIITANANLREDALFVKNGITYHALEANLPKRLGNLSFLHETSSLWFKPIFKILRELRRIGPDIVHAHGTEGYFGLPALVYPQRSILSVQGIISQIYVEDPRCRYAMLRPIEWLTIKLSKNIHVKTSIQYEFVQSVSKKSKIYFIEIPVDSKFFEIDQPGYAPTLFFVGSIIRRKGIEDFLRTFNMLKSTFCTLKAFVIGPDDQRLAHQFLQMYVDLNNRKDLFFTGQLTHREIINLYERGGILCMASHVETSSNVVMEAMAAGLPVVATDVGEIARVVQDGWTGFIVPRRDVTALFSAVSKLLDDSGLFLKAGVRAREIASQRWHPELIASKHFEMYEEVRFSCDRSK